jgi:uncharacterized membrane protein
VSLNLQAVAIEEDSESASRERSHYRIFSVLFAVGLLTFFVGMALLTVAATLLGHGNTSFGVVIFLGPLPIAVGAGSEPSLALSVAALLAVLTVTALLLSHKRRKRLDH